MVSWTVELNCYISAAEDERKEELKQPPIFVLDT